MQLTTSMSVALLGPQSTFTQDYSRLGDDAQKYEENVNHGPLW